MAADCGGKIGCTPKGRGTISVGELTGLVLFLLAGGGDLPVLGKDDSLESLDGQRGLVDSLKHNKF